MHRLYSLAHHHGALRSPCGRAGRPPHPVAHIGALHCATCSPIITLLCLGRGVPFPLGPAAPIVSNPPQRPALHPMVDLLLLPACLATFGSSATAGLSTPRLSTRQNTACATTVWRTPNSSYLNPSLGTWGSNPHYRTLLVVCVQVQFQPYADLRL